MVNVNKTTQHNIPVIGVRGRKNVSIEEDFMEDLIKPLIQKRPVKKNTRTLYMMEDTEDDSASYQVATPPTLPCLLPTRSSEHLLDSLKVTLESSQPLAKRVHLFHHRCATLFSSELLGLCFLDVASYETVDVGMRIVAGRDCRHTLSHASSALERISCMSLIPVVVIFCRLTR
jgi:hypothetical protein